MSLTPLVDTAFRRTIDRYDGCMENQPLNYMMALLRSMAEGADGDVERLTRERDEALALVDALRTYLSNIERSADAGTTGDGHAECVALARAGLATVGPAALAEVRARVWDEAAELAYAWQAIYPLATVQSVHTANALGLQAKDRAAALRAEAQG